jgi:hexosaminidase
MLKDYIAYIRSFGIDVIPEVQSLAHVQYLTHAHPEIAEIAETNVQEKVDTRVEDTMPSVFYHHDYCPSNPRTYEILFDVIDEIIEVFEPREYIHMGHDEVRFIGVCPKCKGKSPAELFAYDINKIHDHLASKGLKMMIWADMLHPMPKYPTHPAIDRIPKDIVLLDFIWYFHLNDDIEENLLAKDFQVLFGNLYSSHFPRYESRIRKEGIHGGQISAWVATNEYELQKEGKLYDLFMTAQLLWAESYSPNYRLLYDRMISAAMPRLREDLNKIRYPSRLPGAQRTVLGENLITFPPKAPEQQVSFPVNARCGSLIFHHTALRKITRQPWSHLDVVARYTLTYEDGSTEQIPVTYGGNIGYWNRRQNAPLASPFYRHTGYTATYYSDSQTDRTEDGQIVTTYIYEYLPKQDKAIASVVLEQDPAFEAKVFLRKLEGIVK